MTTWNLEGMKTHLFICNGSSCMNKDGEEITQAIRDEIQRNALDKEIHTTRTRCNGRCKDACVVIAYPQGIGIVYRQRSMLEHLYRICIMNPYITIMFLHFEKGHYSEQRKQQPLKGLKR